MALSDGGSARQAIEGQGAEHVGRRFGVRDRKRGGGPRTGGQRRGVFKYAPIDQVSAACYDAVPFQAL